MRRLTVPALTACSLSMLLATPIPAHATRRFFQPTSLEVEEPGMLELDLQFEFIRGADAYRLGLPDFELDIGVFQSLEIDLDGAFSLQDSPGETRSFDQVNADNLWLAGKVPIVRLDDDTAERSWNLGGALQLGPKFPTAPDTFGVGVEGLALLGLQYGGAEISLNAGGFADPEVHGGHRPIAFETGIDASYDLDAGGTWSLTGSIGAVHFFSDDPDQLTFTAGVAFDPTPWLEVSLMGLAGTLPGGDRYGVVVGFTPSFRLWN